MTSNNFSSFVFPCKVLNDLALFEYQIRLQFLYKYPLAAAAPNTLWSNKFFTPLRQSEKNPQLRVYEHDYYFYPKNLRTEFFADEYWENYFVDKRKILLIKLNLQFYHTKRALKFCKYLCILFYRTVIWKDILGARLNFKEPNLQIINLMPFPKSLVGLKVKYLILS